MELVDKETKQQSDMRTRRKIGLVMHSVYNAKFFLVPHIHMLAADYDVTLYVRNDAPNILSEMNLPVRIVEVPISRRINLIGDLKALLILIWLFIRDRPDLIHTMTAKAGLLGIIAAFITRVPCRLHTFQGEVWPHFKGLKRSFFRLLDWMVVQMATDITLVSASERDFLNKEGVLKPNRGVVLGAGSICGVDLERFKPNPNLRAEFRKELNINEDDFVFLYLGRLQRDKGLNVLKEAYLQVRRKTDKIMHIIIVGPDEDNLGEALYRDIGSDVILKAYTDRPEDYISISDVLLLPSFREGFGMVLIEAAAMGVPAIASNIYGISCAVEDNVSGLLFDVGDPNNMAQKMEYVIENPNELNKLAIDGKERCEDLFDQKTVLYNFKNYYVELLERRT